MIVQEIDDMDKIQPNNIFVIPYNKGIEVTDGQIKLIPRSDSSAEISIDILFTSLTEVQKERIIDIILSGSASDGTMGIKAIKQEGGLTFAQDDTAKFTSMPHSAIATGMVDFSLNLLINDILDLAKVNSGRMTFEKQPFELHKSIQSILYSFDQKLKENNLELIKEYDSPIPPMLLGDAARLNQIILNLVGNAVKFTHKGHIIVSVKMLNETEENVTLEFTVTDSGIGIAANKIDSIFNLFEQAELNTANSYGGTGLGLSIVKQLIEAQGGSMSVSSVIGEGSIFSFTLTFGKTDLKPEEEIIIQKQDSDVKKLKVLVAEDVALNQLLIKIILGDFGFEYEIVGNGKIAIEKLQTNTYDIILMDLQMPEMNGFEATNTLETP